METKANYVTVGIFTLVAIIAAFAFVYWSAAIGDRGETVTLRVRIPGSASGLGRGSAVLFNGVKVGDVTRVFIDVQNPSAAIADTTIDRLTPITRSTQADIGLAGLTGQANIELKGGNLQEPNVLDEAESQGKIAEITADPSAVTNLLQTAQDIFERADTVITNLEGFVGTTRGPLEQTARNAATFSDALARNADGIDAFLSSVSQLSDEVAGVSGRLDSTLSSAQGLLEAVDRAKVQTIVSNAEQFSNDLRSAGQRVDAISTRVDSVVASADTIVRSLNDTANTINGVAQQSRGTLAKVDGILDGVDPATVRSALSNIEQTSRSANEAAATIRDLSQRATPIFDNVGKVAEKFGGRADEIDKLIADAGSLTGRLNDASARVGAVVAQAGTVVDRVGGAVGRADTILQGVDPAAVRSALTNIEQTTRSANEAAANIRDLSKRASPIVDDVGKVAEKFGNRAGEIDKLIADAGSLTGRLNDASARVGAVVDRVGGAVGRADSILQGVDPATVRSALSNIEQTSRSANTAAANIRDLSQRATPIFDNVGKVVEKFGNRAGEIDKLIVDAGSLTGRLNDASARVGAVVAQAGTVVDRVGGAVGRADGILQSFDPATVRSALANIEQTSRSANTAAANIRDFSQRVGPIIDDVGKVTASIGNRTADIDRFVADAGQLAGRLNAASTRVGSVVEQVDNILQGVSPDAVRSSVENIQQATITANSAVTTFRDVGQTAANVVGDINGVTSRIAARSGDIDQFVADASQLAGRLNAASVRVDGILGRVDDLLGSDQATGLVAEASETLRSFRQVADTLNGRIGPIADNFQRFSAQGLTDVRGLVQESQRAVNRIESAVDELQRNPQRLIFGGEGEVPRYNGRARR